MSANKMRCPSCGNEMNHHADKLTYASPGDPVYSAVFGGSIEEMHTCPACGANASRVSVS